MKKDYKDLHTSPRILMGPGPSDMHPRVYKALSTQMIGHLDSEFVDIMDEVKSMAQATFQTSNELTFVVSAPGSAGMETCLVNLIEPGDEVLICQNGVFGGRMASIAQRAGAKVLKIEKDWGQAFTTDEIKQALEQSDPKLVAIVHAETSTGVRQDLKSISKLVHDKGALFVVDAVTSYCGIDLRVDDWEIDAIYSGTQKCLSAPPGLSPVSFSPRAVEALDRRKTPVQSWFLDLSLVKSYWSGAKRAYHHTAPISQIFALREAYRLVLEEGLENRFARHQEVHLHLKKGLENLGFRFLVDEDIRLPMLNAVYLPEGIDELAVRQRLLNEYNIEVGGGLGAFAGKLWRIGLMGHSCDKNHVNMLISALHDIL